MKKRASFFHTGAMLFALLVALGLPAGALAAEKTAGVDPIVVRNVAEPTEILESRTAARLHDQEELEAPVLTLRRAVANNVGLTWTAVANAEYYIVCRSTDGYHFNQYATSPNPWYSDTATGANGVCYYAVVAVHGSGEDTVFSDMSNAVTANLSGIHLTPPVVTLNRTAVNNVGLTWPAVENARSYVIFRTTALPSLSQYATSSNPWFTDTDTAAGTTYYYLVVAASEAGGLGLHSESSNLVTATVPAAPASLAAPVLTLNRTVANNVGLTWTAVSGATGYRLYRGTTSGNLTLYKTVTNPWYSDTATPVGTTWYYQVAAYNADTTGSRSNTVTANIPAAPVSLSAPVLTLNRAVANNVGLTWTAVSGATGYNLYRGTTSGNLTLYKTVTNPWYSDTATPAGTIWYYQVAAYNAGTTGSRSNTVAANIPAASAVPVLTLNRAVANDVGLSWTADAEATYYCVYRGTTSGNLTLLEITPKSWYVDTLTPAGATYYYQVAVYKNNTTGPLSNMVVANIAAPLTAPVLTLARTAANNVGLTWTAVSGATGYRLYRGTTSGNLTLYKSVISPWYSDTATPAGATYYYQVAAYNASTTGSRSNMVSANIPAAPVSLSTPVLTLARTVANNVGLTWTAVSGATGYRLYRGTTSGNLTLYKSVISPWYSDTATPAGATYYYQVAAYNASTTGSRSNTVTAMFFRLPPELTLARAVANNVGLTWTAVSGATGYRVYRGTTAENLALYASVANPWYSDTATPAGMTWYYQIAAYTDNTIIVYSNTVTVHTKLPAPVLRIQHALGGNVGLVWNEIAAPSSNLVVRYTILRSTDLNALANMDPSLLPSSWNGEAFSATSPWYTDTTAQPGATYYYKVAASAWCNPAPGMFGCPAPIYGECSAVQRAVVTGMGSPVLNLGALSPNYVSLNWSTIPGATGYSIYRGTSRDDLSWYTSTDETSYADAAAFSGRTYYYQVLAYKAGTPTQYGARSNVIAATPPVGGSCGTNATWMLDLSTGALTISGTGTVWNYSIFGPWHDEYASSIRSVVVQSGITGIGQQAFLDCGAIESITLPDTLTTIGMGAFSSCTALQSIRIPGSVHTIYDSALSFCSSLQSVYFAGNAPTTFGADVLAHCDLNPTIYYYSTKTGWTSPTWNGYPTQVARIYAQ